MEMEEFASSMGQRYGNTPVMDAQTMLRKEEFASGELQSSISDAAVNVVLNFLRMNECS